MTNNPTDRARYGWWGWAPEPDVTGDGEGDPDKHFLTIIDTDGEEFAVIVHRTCEGRFPIDGQLANQKLERAQKIVDALNAYALNDQEFGDD